MTIALSIKVHDGIVLATDSATTIFASSNSVYQVYNSANKLFNLYKGLPIGMITYGAGSIGYASISTLAKDFRSRLTEEGAIDRNNYQLRDIVGRVCSFFFEGNYQQAYQGSGPGLGFVVAGYSAGGDLPEEWQIHIENDTCSDPVLLRTPEEVGVTFEGEPEALSRIIYGFGTQLPGILLDFGVQVNDIPDMVEIFRTRMHVPLVTAPMPIQDAIDLAKFLVEASITFSKFSPGAPTVGGPVEIATITKHEGFKWISRKHYFDSNYNPT